MANGEGDNALHLLCTSRRPVAVEMIRSRLGRGANPRKKAEEGLTPLHLAAAYDNIGACQLLMHFGADPLAKDDYDRTPYSMATGVTKQFLERHLKRDRRLRRGILRRLFVCYTPGTPPAKENKGFIHDVRNRLRKSLATMLGDPPALDISSCSTAHEFQLSDIPVHIRRADEPPKTPRRARTPDGRLERTPKPDFVGSAKAHKTPRQIGQGVNLENKTKAVPSAPPLTPIPIREKHDYSQDYLTAEEESFDLNDLQNRFNQLSLATTPSRVDESKLRRIKRLKDSELRVELRKHGVHAGPICSRTRRMYEKKLACLIDGQELVQGVTYSRQLEAALNNKFDFSKGKSTDDEIRLEYETDGVTAFIYLLIDPRVVSSGSSPTFRQFVEAVFYVGKGTNARPLAHLIDARRLREANSPKVKTSAKLKKIDSIWKCGRGVGVIQVNNMIGDSEAFVREAALIEAIRLENLTNIKGGQWNGASRNWDTTTRAEFGVHLLKLAFDIFSSMGIRQIHPESLPETTYPFVTTRRR